MGLGKGLGNGPCTRDRKDFTKPLSNVPCIFVRAAELSHSDSLKWSGEAGRDGWKGVDSINVDFISQSCLVII